MVRGERIQISKDLKFPQNFFKSNNIWDENKRVAEIKNGRKKNVIILTLSVRIFSSKQFDPGKRNEKDRVENFGEKLLIERTRTNCSISFFFSVGGLWLSLAKDF